MCGEDVNLILIQITIMPPYVQILYETLRVNNEICVYTENWRELPALCTKIP